MTRVRMVAALALLVLSTSSLLADVRADEKTRVEFAGALGRMMNIFGGKAARDGVTSMVAVKGDRKATLNDATGQIIDLKEEKIYDLDLKKKTYKVTTFEELRRRMDEAQKKAGQNAQKDQPANTPSDAARDEKTMEIDFDVKNTGQRKTIDGFDTSQAIMTITVREKGKTLEQSGGLVLTSDMWLAPKIAAMSEILDFEVRYAKKLYGPMMGASAEEMAAALALYPMMKPAMDRMRTEGAKIDGTPILTTTTFEGVKSAEQFAAEQKQREDDSKTSVSGGGGLGGFAGGLVRRAAQKKIEGDPTPRTTVLTGTTEVLKVVTDVSAADVAVPAGFKEAK